MFTGLIQTVGMLRSAQQGLVIRPNQTASTLMVEKSWCDGEGDFDGLTSWHALPRHRVGVDPALGP